jgi:hypothetical protein
MARGGANGLMIRRSLSYFNRFKEFYLLVKEKDNEEALLVSFCPFGPGSTTFSLSASRY